MAGESCGTTRAAGLAQHLNDRYGMMLNGVVLISSVLIREAYHAKLKRDIAAFLKEAVR